MNWLFSQSDKRKHFLGGGLLAMILTFILFKLGFTIREAFLSSIVAISLVGFIKEEQDRKKPKTNTEEARDAFATYLGAISGAVAAYLSLLNPFISNFVIGL